MEQAYDSTFLCTYKQLDDDDIYRAQFLQAFKCKEWNDSEINTKTDIVFMRSTCLIWSVGLRMVAALL